MLPSSSAVKRITRKSIKRSAKPILFLFLCLAVGFTQFNFHSSAPLARFGTSAHAAPQMQLETPITVITVNTAGDPDAGDDKLTCDYTRGAFFFPGDETGQTCSLRWAWNEANARPPEDRPIGIRFDIPTTDPNYELNAPGTWVISMAEAFPGLDPDNGANGTSIVGKVYIDGGTQPGGRTNGPKIIIDNRHASWEIFSESNYFANLAFRGGGGIQLKEGSNTIEAIWIGLTDDGQGISFVETGQATEMAGNGLFVDSDNNMIQNSTISGIKNKAIDLDGGASNNIIQRNNIGTFADGTVPTIPQNVQCLASFSKLSDQHYGGWGISIAGSNNLVTENRFVGMHNLRSVNDTAPIALAILGDSHDISNNIIGRDSAGNDLGVCGQGIQVSDTNTSITKNTIVRSRTGFESTEGEALDGAILASDSAASPFGQITIRENIVIDGPGDIYVFSPLLPEVLKLFRPGHITSIVGTSVTGTNGEGSLCPQCIVDFYLDDDDPTQETLTYIGNTTADINGNFTYELPQPLSPGQTIRTASTTQTDDVIGTYDAGTTTKFSDPYGPDGQLVTPIAPTPTPTVNIGTVEPVNSPTPTSTPTASPEPTPTSQPSTIITVNTTSDPNPTDNKLTCSYERGALFFPGDGTGTTCSFRWAWNEAIGRPQEDRPIEIRFDIPETDPNSGATIAGTWVIQMAGVLPELNPDNGSNNLSTNGQVYIDGATQPNGRTDGPKIIIDTDDESWKIFSENNLIANLSFRGGGAIFLHEDNNVIENIWMGLTDDGQQIHFRTPGDLKRMAHGGISILSSNNIVRGNVISGSFAKAVDVNSSNDNNLIVDNYIGTRADGTVPLLDPANECVPGFDLLPGSWKGGWGISLAGTGNKVINNVMAGLDNFRSTNDTPPRAIEIFGDAHIIEGNLIGRDAAGTDVGVCGQGIKFSDTNHQIIRNVIVRSRQDSEASPKTAILASDGALGAFGQVTIRENIIVDSPEDNYAFIAGIPEGLRFFNPAKITTISGTTVMGTSGTDSYCPGCLIDFYLDDLDDVQESLVFLGSTLADSMGNFTYEMTNPLTPDTALRTASTSMSSNVIPGLGPGTTTKFSTLSIPVETVTIDGPSTGDPGATYFYTVTVGPAYSGRPVSMTVTFEDIAIPSNVTFGEGEPLVRIYEVQWQADGIKTIDVAVENDMNRVSTSLDMDLGGEDPAPTSTPSDGTPGPSESPTPSDGTPGPSESPTPSDGTPGPSESPTPSDGTPGPSESPTPSDGTPGPSESPTPSNGTPSPSESPTPSETPSSEATDQPLNPGGTDNDNLYLPLVQG